MDIKIDITALLGHLNPRGSRLNSNSDNLDVLWASQSQTEKPIFLPDDAADVAATDDNQIGFMNLHPPEICDLWSQKQSRRTNMENNSCKELLNTLNFQ